MAQTDDRTGLDSCTRDVERANPHRSPGDALREIAEGLTRPSTLPLSIFWYRAAAAQLRQIARDLEMPVHNGVDWGRIRASVQEVADADHSDELLRRS